MYLIGYDIGSSSVKASIIEAHTGKCVVSAFSPSTEMSIHARNPGWAEQDADKVWWADVVQICKVLLNNDPYTGEDVSGVALSAIGPCMLPLDKKGKPFLYVQVYCTGWTHAPLPKLNF